MSSVYWVKHVLAVILVSTVKGCESAIHRGTGEQQSELSLIQQKTLVQSENENDIIRRNGGKTVQEMLNVRKGLRRSPNWQDEIYKQQKNVSNIFDNKGNKLQEHTSPEQSNSALVITDNEPEEEHLRLKNNDLQNATNGQQAVITESEPEEERNDTDAGHYQAVYNGYQTMVAPIRGQGVNYGQQAVITDSEPEEERNDTDAGHYQAVYNGYQTMVAPIMGQGVNYGEQAQQSRLNGSEEVWSEIGGGPSQELGVWNWYRGRWRGRTRSRGRGRRVRGRWRWNKGGRKGGWNQGGGGGGGGGRPVGGGGEVPPTGSSKQQSYSEFEQDALETHNKFRRIHSAADMRLDRELCDQAAGFARKIANLGFIQHSSEEERGDLGENLAQGSGQMTGREAVTMWYDEVCKYNFNSANPEFDMATGHFTQVVWRDSLVLGMGKAEGKDRRGRPATFIVGRYRPPGNYNRQFKDKVRRGRFDPSYCNSVQDSLGK